MTPGIKKYVQGLISEDKLSAEEILQIFNVDEIKFKNVLRPICQNILELFYFINKGELIQIPRDFVKLNQILETEGVEKIWHKNDLTLPAMLKLLVVIMENLHGNKFFLKTTVQKLPYFFDNTQFFSLNYDSTSRAFQLINKEQFAVDSFSSVRLEFQFGLYIEQLIQFKNAQNFEGLDIDIQCCNQRC